MKRLISWLLALTLICGLLPLSVFAAGTDVETGDSTSDFDVDMWELQDGGSAENRLLISFVMNAANTEGTASVTVPAGKTLYAEYQGDPSYELSVDGVAHTFVAAADRTDTNKFEITNGTDAEKTYALKIALPVGTYNNPEVIEELAYSYFTVEQAAGDNDGYCYIYTAPADGTVTLYFTETPCDVYEAPTTDEEGNEVPAKWHADIVVVNNNTYENKSLQYDGVDNYGWELTVDVNAGDELSINTSYCADAEGNKYPAGTYTWCGNFTYPAGTEKNPIVLEWAWDDAYTTATASTTTEADGTYYTGTAGMILTVDGEEVAMDEMGVFQLNAGEHNLVLSTPVGAQANPEVIEDMNDYSDSNSLAADGAYYYIWTATEDGTVTLDVTDGANITVDKLTYTEDSEWPISTQYALAEPVVDENYNYTGWTVAENLVIEVVAGEQLKIQVNALTDWSTWTTPAIDYTLTGDFEAAETGPIADASLKFAQVGLSFQDYIGMNFVIMKSLADKYDRIYVESVQAAPEGDIEATLEKIPMQSVAYFFDQQIMAWSMTEEVTVTLYAEKDGQLYVGQTVTTSIEDLALEKIASYKTAGNTKACQTLVDMLNYGAAVQVGYDHNASSLPSAGEYASMGTAETPVIEGTNSSAGTGSVKILTTSVSMQAKVELQVIFMASAISAGNYELRYTVDGVTTAIPASEFTDMQSFKVGRVAVKAANMRKDYTVALYNVDTGECVSSVETMSVVAFGQKSIDNNSNVDVVIALMKYGDSVAAL